MAEIEEASVEVKLREAGRHSIVYGLGSIAQSAVGFFLLPLLTGLLSKDAYGAYSLILMASTIAGAIFYLGMNSAMPRSYYDYKSIEDRRAVFTTAFVVLAFGAMAQMALGFLWGKKISSVLLHEDTYSEAIAWAFLASSLTFINQFFFTYLRFLRKSATSVLFSLFSLVGGVGLTVLLVNNDPGNLVCPFAAIALSQLAIATVFSLMFGRSAFTFKVKSQELTKLIPFGIASVVASFAAMLLDWSDRPIIERYVSIADVGVYSAAYKLGSLLNVILVLPFSQIWFPMMLEYRNHHNIKALFTSIFFSYTIIGAVVIVGASLFIGDFVPLLVRSGSNDALLSVTLLVMFGFWVYGTVNILAAGLHYERRLGLLIYVLYALAGVKISVNFVVIPIFGIVGAAITTAVTYAVIPIMIYLAARRYFSFVIEWKRIGILGLICAPPFIYGTFYWSIFPIWWPIRVVLFVVVCLGLYSACLSSNEKSQVKGILSDLCRRYVGRT